jgi:hypothetical protein
MRVLSVTSAASFKMLAVNALFMGVLMMLPAVAQALDMAADTELALVRLAQTGADGNFSLALVSDSSNAAADGSQDLRRLTSLCKQIRVFGKVQPNTNAALRHDAAMAQLKQAAVGQKSVRFQFGDASLKVANKTLPCALRSHGLLVDKNASGDVIRFAPTSAATIIETEKSNHVAKPVRPK